MDAEGDMQHTIDGCRSLLQRASAGGSVLTFPTLMPASDARPPPAMAATRSN